MPPLSIFLDLGGVINDKEQQLTHWQYLAGKCCVELPDGTEEEDLRLAYRAIGSITSRVRAALPGAVETIHLLHHLGYTLHLASGACSLELVGYLDGMGVRHY